MKHKCYDILVAYVVENQAKFYRLAFSYTHTKEPALDIVQNAICKALENYSSIRNIAFIKTWFYRVLVNECLTYLNKNSKESPSDFSDVKEPIYVESAYEHSEQLYEQVNFLPPEQQIIIKLHYYEELTLKEISEITGTNLNTVKTRLYAGLKKLRIQVEEELL